MVIRVTLTSCIEPPSKAWWIGGVDWVPSLQEPGGDVTMHEASQKQLISTEAGRALWSCSVIHHGYSHLLGLGLMILPQTGRCTEIKMFGLRLVCVEPRQGAALSVLRWQLKRGSMFANLYSYLIWNECRSHSLLVTETGVNTRGQMNKQMTCLEAAQLSGFYQFCS